ncbi:MAG TPA: hypothetical protein VG797_10895, partial [Phycisphaerales bacterium]|nr:hypothetical protein [Phycisphaerales bacterium]
AAPAAQTVGDRGGFKVTMVVDSRHADRQAFVNDKLLHWLRSNAEREGSPLHYVEIPSINSITIEDVSDGKPPTLPGAANTPARSAPASRTTPTRGEATAGRGQSGATGAGTTGSASSTAASTPEIPERMIPPAREGPVFRYTLSWVAQIKDPHAAKPADPAASGGAAPAGGAK